MAYNRRVNNLGVLMDTVNIASELHAVDFDIYVTTKGLARLCGVAANSVRYLKKMGGETAPSNSLKALPVKDTMGGESAMEIEITGIRPDGRPYTTKAIGYSSKLAVEIVKYFALSPHVTREQREKATQALVAFAHRGYLAWASDMLGCKVDVMDANASINTLLELYPGNNTLLAGGRLTRPMSVKEWLTEFKYPNDPDTVEKLYRPVAVAASQTYKTMKGANPTQVAAQVGAIPVQVNVYDDDAILEVALAKVLR